MKHIRIASDLHLEGFASTSSDKLIAAFLPPSKLDAESTLVLAGDISSIRHQLVEFVSECAKQFPSIIYIPGNHEYYRHNMHVWNAEMVDELKKACPDIKMALGSVGSHITDGTRFIYGTLWGDGGPGPASQAEVGYSLNDFRLITYYDAGFYAHERRFNVRDMMEIHAQQKFDIAKLLSTKHDGKTVVITHHLPSRQLVSARFLPTNGSDGCNGGFVGDCDDIIFGDNAPDLWIHGHTHDRVSRMLHNTRIECNPTGYRGEWDNGYSGGRGSTVIIDLDEIGQPT